MCLGPSEKLFHILQLQISDLWCFLSVSPSLLNVGDVGGGCHNGRIPVSPTHSGVSFCPSLTHCPRGAHLEWGWKKDHCVSSQWSCVQEGLRQRDAWCHCLKFHPISAVYRANTGANATKRRREAAFGIPGWLNVKKGSRFWWLDGCRNAFGAPKSLHATTWGTWMSVCLGFSKERPWR